MIATSVSYYQFSIICWVTLYSTRNWTFLLAIYQGCKKLKIFTSYYVMRDKTHTDVVDYIYKYTTYWLTGNGWLYTIFIVLYIYAIWWLQTSAKCVNLFSIACWWILLYCLVENSSILTAWLMFSNKLFKPFCYFSRQLFNVTTYLFNFSFLTCYHK